MNVTTTAKRSSGELCDWIKVIRGPTAVANVRYGSKVAIDLVAGLGGKTASDPGPVPKRPVNKTFRYNSTAKSHFLSRRKDADS